MSNNKKAHNLFIIQKIKTYGIISQQQQQTPSLYIRNKCTNTTDIITYEWTQAS